MLNVRFLLQFYVHEPRLFLIYLEYTLTQNPFAIHSQLSSLSANEVMLTYTRGFEKNEFILVSD